jgi:hypothetical protein
MKTDTVTKILLALIALGLWLNLWVSRPFAASAAVPQVEENDTLARIEMLVDNIDENLEIITLGSCMNSRLC